MCKRVKYSQWRNVDLINKKLNKIKFKIFKQLNAMQIMHTAFKQLDGSHQTEINY